MYTCTYIIGIKLRSSNVPIPLFHYRSNTDTFQGKLANTDPIPILCHTGITHKKQLTVVNKPAISTVLVIGFFQIIHSIDQLMLNFVDV